MKTRGLPDVVCNIRVLATIFLIAIAATSVGCGGGSPGGTILPTVAFVFPVDGAVANGTTITVTGRSTLNADIATLEINGIPVVTNDGFATWQATIPLVPGTNPIRARMVDTSGRLFDEAALVTVDNAGHLILGIIDIAATSTGKTLVAELWASSVTEVDPTTGHRRILGIPADPSPPQLDLLSAVTVSPDGSSIYVLRHVFVSGETRIDALDPVTGTFTQIYHSQEPGTTAQPTYGSDLTIDPTGQTLYITSTQSEPGTPGSPTGYPSVFALTPGSSQAVLISDENNGSGPSLDVPSGIVHDGTRLLVLDRETDSILAVDIATGDRSTVVSTVTGTPVLPVRVLQLAHDPVSGYAYVLDIRGERVFAVDVGSGTSTVLSGPSTGTGPPLAFARAIDFDVPNDRIIVALDDGLLAVNPNDGRRTVVSALRRGSGPDLSGRVYLAAGAGPTDVFALTGAMIVRCDTRTGARTLVSGPTRGTGPPLSLPMFTYDPVRDRIFAATASGLLSIDPQTGDRTLVAAIPDWTIENVHDLQYDAVEDRLLMVRDTRLDAFDADTATFTPIPTSIPLSSGTLTGSSLILPDTGEILAVVSDVVEIDRATGDVDVIAPLPAGGVKDAIYDASRARFLILVFDVEGVVAIDRASGSETVLPFGTPAREFTSAWSLLACPQRGTALVAPQLAAGFVPALTSTTDSALYEFDVDTGDLVLVSR